jgi:hypothetical protein
MVVPPAEVACANLRTLFGDAAILTPPFVMGAERDAALQAQLASDLDRKARELWLPSGSDPTVTEVKAAIAGYSSALDRLSRRAAEYVNAPNSQTFAEWEEAWHIAAGASAYLQYVCR